ncbi:hypothetical protein CPC08DRAFT_652149 [Agrocybe pediades]|nr:hypothetical protein CPC08DRAFT_652149 [Agrocybe pediades]
MKLHRQTYLEEMLRWEGRGDFQHSDRCPDCIARCSEAPGLPQYRCEECFIPDLVCQACCVRRHRVQPFHHIEQWDGIKFKRISLKMLGLKLQLNHSSTYCDNPVPCHENMLILHVNGIHDVSVQYCGCTRAIPHHIQLLRRRLYPASQLSVKACASFELLELLHKLALTTKASTYDFYRALEKLTTGLGYDVPASRYKPLLRMIMQWRHLKMLKWAGRGNDPTGVEGTKSGDLAIRCPSCPIPGVNLPANWEEVPYEMR